jgi:WD40 repeat protein
VLRFCSIVAEAPLQVYSSALLFAPERSIVRKTFVDQISWEVEMLSDREADWDACRSVLEGHTAYVSAMVFSWDGQLVASASYDKTVRVWETATGTCRHKLTGHTGAVIAVVFSPDGQFVASASEDNTVRVWETATGTCRHELTGHTGGVNAVMFSRDGQLVASASRDKTVRVWETATGTCRHELTGHTNYVSAVVFSQDGQLVASASWDKTVRVWETATGTCRIVLDNPDLYIWELAFSPDGSALHTDKGDIVLPSDLNLTSPVQLEDHDSNLLVKDQWVLRDTQRFLWLPFEYRGYSTVVCQDMVCLGCPSGRVALLKLQ